MNWRPDWRDDADYPADAHPLVFAWEFLRRNVDYQADYIYAISHPDEYVHEPPLLPGETVDEWADRIEKNLGNPDMSPLSIVYGEKYGLCEMIDPAENDPFIAPWPPAGGTVIKSEWQNGGQIRKFSPAELFSHEIAVTVNIHEPLDMEIRRIESLLRSIRRSMGVADEKKPRRRDDKYQTYLRVLDAHSAEAGESEIASVMFPHIENSYPDYLGRQRVRDTLQAAKRMSEHGYRALLRGRGAIQLSLLADPKK